MVEILLTSCLAVLLLVSLLCIYLNYRRNPKSTILNPITYCLLCSVFYLGVPFIDPGFLFEHFGYDVSLESLIEVKMIALYLNLVFFVGYVLSTKFLVPKIKDIYMVGSLKWYISAVLIIILVFMSIFSLWLLIKYGSSLLAASFISRNAAYLIYLELFNAYRLSLIFTVSLVIAITLVVFDRFRVLYFLPSSLLVLLSLLSGDRDLAFNFFVTIFLLNVIRASNDKVRKLVRLLMWLITLLVILRWLQNGYMSGAERVRYDYLLLSEFYHTAFTTTYIIQNELLYVGNLFDYASSVLLKIFSFVLDVPRVEWYADIVSNQIGRGFGFAGNIASEALFYGGYPLLFIFPFLILIMMSISFYFWKHGQFLGFVMLFVLIPYTRLFFRGSFFDNYMSIFIWGMVLICPMLFFTLNKKVVKYVISHG